MLTVTPRQTSQTRLVACTVAVLALVALTSLTAAAAATAAAGPHCSNPTEAYYVDDGRDYSGRVNVTESGIPCQAWTAQSPNRHDTDVTGAGLGDHNYCRNPNGLARPWCVTTDPIIPYQFCDVGEPCPVVPDAPTVSSSPMSGTHFPSQQSAVVSLSCFPSPCELYYTLEGSNPVPGVSTLYSGPFQLRANATVKYAGLFASGEAYHRVAFFTLPAGSPAGGGAYFIPTDAIVYTSPVLASLQGTTASDTVLYYLDGDFKGLYTGPLWLNLSTVLVAIVNGKTVGPASYRLNVTAPALALYPPSGTYIGGAAVLAYAATTEAATYSRSVNGSTEWVPMTNGTRFTIESPGVTRVLVKAVFLGGVESYAEGVYTILAAAPPVIEPSPAVNYSRPVQVVCTDPAGQLLELGGAAVPEGQLLYSLRLATPGRYNASCTYSDYLRQAHTTAATVTLVTLTLPASAELPACGDSFPRTPLRLGVRVLGPLDNALYYNGSVARLDVSASLLNAPASRMGLAGLARTGPDTFHYNLTPEAGQQAAERYAEVRFVTSSVDPMEADSPAMDCRYHILPLAAARTAVVAARPSAAAVASGCVTGADGNMGSDCSAAIGAQLAACLHFTTSDLIVAESVGPFVLVAVSRLDASITALYESKVMACLRDNSSVAVTEPVSELGGGLALATGWRVAVSSGGATAPRQEVPAGSGFLAEVAGFHPENATDYRFVREGYSCDDIGFPALNMPSAVGLSMARDFGVAPATAMMLDLASSGRIAGGEVRVDLGAQSLGSDMTPLVFSIDSPGRYKLCARIAGATFVVPSRYAALEGVLVVAPGKWPSIAASASCGGLVPSAFAEVPIAVSFAAAPAGFFYNFYYSHSAGPWYEASLDASLVLPGSVQSYTSPVRVVSASLGPATGADAAMCVYYAPAVSPPINLTHLTYGFYQVGNVTRETFPLLPSPSPELGRGGQEGSAADGSSASGPTNNTAAIRYDVRGDAELVVSLGGHFQVAERIVVQVYQEVADTASAERTMVTADNTTIGLRLVASTLASASPGLNLTVAVPDYTIRLNFSRAGDLLHVLAVLDGEAALPISPSKVALSPLAIGMYACEACRTGYCYGVNECVCIGTVNKTAYLCDGGRDEPVVPDTPLYERLLLLFVYFAILLGVGVGFLVAIRAGTARNRRYAEAVAAGEVDGPAVRPLPPPRQQRAIDVTVIGDDEQQSPP